MKVAILSPYPAYPFQSELGIRITSHQNNATWTVALAKALASLPGMEIHVLTESEDLPATKVILADNVRLHFLKAPPRFKTLSFYQLSRRRLHAALRDIAPDIVHGQGLENQYGYAAVTTSCPHVLTIHGIPGPANVALGYRGWNRNTLYGRIVEWGGKATLRRARNIILINPYVAEACALRDPLRRRFPIPNAVDEKFFHVTATTPEPALILCVGSVDRRKGQDILLEALRLLRERGIPARAILAGPAGNADYLAGLRRFTQEHQLDVRFTGFATPDEVFTLMQRCELLALPSRHETAPVAMTEAMAIGLPVVATRVAGVPHMIADGETGLLVAPENAAQLADALQRLLSDAALRQRLAAQARQTARDTYHPARVAALTRAAYEEILRNERTT